MTHKIINIGKPEEISSMILPSQRSRNNSNNKLAPKPKKLNTNIKTKQSFRSRSYLYNTLPGALTSITNKYKFKEN